MIKGTKYKAKPLRVVAYQFPDNGPEQHELSSHIERTGGVANLYDGNVQQNVETSTDANWRWRSMSIKGAHRWVGIGDLVFQDANGQWQVMEPSEFETLYQPIK